MSKFLNDICRAVGCDDKSICDRCGNPTMGFFKKMVNNVLDGTSPYAPLTSTIEIDMDEVLDELDQVELLICLEEEYNIEINDNEADKLKTPEMFYNYLYRLLGKTNVQSV